MSKRKDPINDFFAHFDTLGDEAQQLVASILMTKVKKKVSGNGAGKSSSAVLNAKRQSSSTKGVRQVSAPNIGAEMGNVGIATSEGGANERIDN